jgi:hypothetical protein
MFSHHFRLAESLAIPNAAPSKEPVILVEEVTSKTDEGQEENEPEVVEQEESQECSICFEDLIPNKDLRALPCGHKYHALCISQWIVEFSPTCPIW